MLVAEDRKIGKQKSRKAMMKDAGWDNVEAN
jgi:hypothetical protein